MRTTYGLSDATRRFKFETIAQTENENEKEFLARVVNSYYNSKGLTKPADEEDSVHVVNKIAEAENRALSRNFSRPVIYANKMVRLKRWFWNFEKKNSANIGVRHPTPRRYYLRELQP